MTLSPAMVDFKLIARVNLFIAISFVHVVNVGIRFVLKRAGPE